MITFEQLNGPTDGGSEILHGFMTRNGGVSDPPFTSLNCGYGSSDDRDKVTANRNRTLEFLGAPDAKLVTGFQEHTNTALPVVAPWSPEDAPVADGLVTTTPGIALGILTADCAPVLMVDSAAGVIGAAHAGWRGALEGILENTLQQMTEMGARIENISTAVGPCIGQKSYEVGGEFKDRFYNHAPNNDRYFIPSIKGGHFMFDLSAYVCDRLKKMDVKSVVVSDADTCEDHDQFFSYRRSTLAGQRQYGRMLSLIVLAE